MGDTRLELPQEYTGNQQVGYHSGADSGALAAQTTDQDPGLALVAKAWSKLPEAIKAGILAMVRARV
jgi:hypothetical protein